MLPPFLTELLLPNLQYCKFGTACRGSSPIQKTKRTEHIRQYTILVGLQGCTTCYETVHWTVSSKFVFAKFGAACRWFESNSKNKKNGAHKAVYHFDWTSRLRNLLRNSPQDCFFQICLRQIWSSLSWFESNSKKQKERSTLLCAPFFWLPKLDSNQRPCG